MINRNGTLSCPTEIINKSPLHFQSNRSGAGSFDVSSWMTSDHSPSTVNTMVAYDLPGDGKSRDIRK